MQTTQNELFHLSCNGQPFSQLIICLQHVKFEETQLESIFQYPSEKSLLNEDQQNKLNQRMTSLATNPGLSSKFFLLSDISSRSSLIQVVKFLLQY